jgi:hypothetical protein
MRQTPFERILGVSRWLMIVGILLPAVWLARRLAGMDDGQEKAVIIMEVEHEEFDRKVRGFIYNFTMERGYPPKLADAAEEFSVPLDEILASFRRLAAARIIVQQRDSGEILMANPFSAVPTPFLVKLDNYDCFANCIWDALGIPAMMKKDAGIQTSCADCGTAFEIRIVENTVLGEPGLLHFAIPARRWWEDIVFT